MVQQQRYRIRHAHVPGPCPWRSTSPSIPRSAFFPPTSERAARMAMLIMFALMAVTLVVLVLDEAGIFG